MESCGRPTQQKNRTIRVFHSADKLQAAIDALLRSGFHRAERQGPSQILHVRT